MYSTYYGSRQDGYGYNADMLREGFDLLEARADCLGWWSVARRVLRSYGHQPIIRLRRSSDSTEQDFYGIGPQGEVSTAAVRAWNGWNLFSQTEFPNGLSDLNVAVGLSTSTSSMGPLGTVPVLVFGDNSTLRYGYKSFIPISGATYTISFYVKMNDGLAPVIGTNSSSGDFSIIAFSSSANDNHTVQNLGNGVYRVSASRTEATTDNNWGLIKYTGQSSRGFVTSGWQVEAGTTATTYEPRTTTGAGNSFLVTLYDQSGLARHFTQSTTTLQPIICEQGVPVTENGRLAGKFVAADARRMSIASSTAMFNALHTTGGSVLIVSRYNETAATKTLLTNQNSNSAIGFRITDGGGSESVSAAIANGVGNVLSVAKSDGPLTTNNVLVWHFDPDNLTAADRENAWRNGTLTTGDNIETNTPSTSNAAADLVLGARAIGTNPHDGPISEVALFSALISTADRTTYQSRSGNFFTVSIS